ncbi:MAG: hypothetical protein ACLQME_12620 [Alphaproteobacteria bacterium]
MAKQRAGSQARRAATHKRSGAVARGVTIDEVQDIGNRLSQAFLARARDQLKAEFASIVEAIQGLAFAQVLILRALDRKGLLSIDVARGEIARGLGKLEKGNPKGGGAGVLRNLVELIDSFKVAKLSRRLH